MRIATALSAALAMLTAANPALAATDVLCARLKTFEAARFDGTEKPAGRRWVQLRWLGYWLDLKHGWGLQCTHSGDAAAKALCDFLGGHTSFEFTNMLPMRIMQCHGYRFPGRYLPVWNDWLAAIPLENALLEVDFHSPGIDGGAIRFSSFAPGQNPATVSLPPLAPSPGA